MSKLNIAILIDSEDIELYKVEIIQELQKSDFCSIVKFIQLPKIHKLEDKNSKYLLYRIFNKFDAKFFGKNTKYLALQSIKDMINNESKKDLSIDVIVNLSASNNYYPNDVKYGVWQFAYHSFPEAYWEVVDDKPFTEVSIYKVGGDGIEGNYLLDTFRTTTDRKSMLKNKDTIAWRSHMMIVRNLKKLALENKNYFSDKKSLVHFNHHRSESKRVFFDPQFGFSDQKRLVAPSNMEMLVVIYKLFKKYLTFSIRKFFPMDRWLILYSETDNGRINSKLSEYKRFYAPSKDYFIADSFVVDEGEKSYLFYEELPYNSYRGYLKVAEYDDKKGIFKESQTILSEDYHLSFPNVFKYENKYYMIPESFENKTVDLFEAVEFPIKWKKKKTLLDNVRAVDATLYQQDDIWWMFVNMVEKDDFSVNDELYLYHCDNLLDGIWIPHAQNPIVSDALTARPAGNLIQKGDKLFRPAQDCSGIYGRKIVINEVDVLNKNEYKEHQVGEITSDFADDLVGVHTFNSSKKLTVIDAIKSR